jgi:5,10-methylene-tetrahydrofolate dehydrogenase/methenyl tetrahydrofolate cyclohydrolase
MFPKMSNDTAAEELVAPTSWMCVATKSDNGLSAKVEIYHGNMKATTGERPHVKIMAASKANDVQVYVASQSSGSSKQSVVKVAEITEQVVQEYLLALIEKLVAEGPPR